MPLMMLKALWGKVWGYVVLAGAILAGLFALRQSGKTAGKQEAERERLETDNKGMENAIKARDEILQMDDDAIRDRARKRMRNAKR
ncbi:hypothetical protein H0A64_15965 [Alcaligenaceae bacterium]|nr:hypothetical protein [Alcaligenaceae bacterium]